MKASMPVPRAHSSGSPLWRLDVNDVRLDRLPVGLVGIDPVLDDVLDVVRVEQPFAPEGMLNAAQEILRHRPVVIPEL